MIMDEVHRTDVWFSFVVVGQFQGNERPVNTCGQKPEIPLQTCAFLDYFAVLHAKLIEIQVLHLYICRTLAFRFLDFPLTKFRVHLSSSLG